MKGYMSNETSFTVEKISTSSKDGTRDLCVNML